MHPTDFTALGRIFSHRSSIVHIVYAAEQLAQAALLLSGSAVFSWRLLALLIYHIYIYIRQYIARSVKISFSRIACGREKLYSSCFCNVPLLCLLESPDMHSSVTTVIVTAFFPACLPSCRVTYTLSYTTAHSTKPNILQFTFAAAICQKPGWPLELLALRLSAFLATPLFISPLQN
jgi:hypothetical protein